MLSNDEKTGVMHCDIGIVSMCLAERKLACQGMNDVSTLILTFTLTFLLALILFSILVCGFCCVVSNLELRYVVSWSRVLCSIELCCDSDVLCCVLWSRV
jgi:hypothetical protein